MKQVLVVNFHRIAADTELFSSRGEKLFSVSPVDFRNFIALLKKCNVPVISLDDYAAGNVPDGFSVALTFDDGYLSDYTIAFPELVANHFPATFFWTADRSHKEYAQWEHAREMVAAGFHFGSHGITHTELTELTEAQLTHELTESKRIIETNTGHAVQDLALPYGLSNPHVIDAARRSGYRLVCTTRVKLNEPEKNSVLLHRWSVKRTTTLEEFGGMIGNTALLQRKISASRFATAARKIIGQKLSDRLNVIRNFNRQEE